MRRRFIETSLGPVHLREAGDGAPLVLLHRTAESGQQFEDVLPCLAPSFRAVAPDTIGFGDSAAPLTPPGIEGYARNVVEVLDRLGIKKTHLLGHRTGASIAVEVAATYPDRVEKLVLSGCPDFDESERTALDFPRPKRELTPDGSYLLTRWQRTVANLGEGVTPEQILRSSMMGNKAAPHPHWAYEAVYAQDMHERIGRITSPTLLLYGERDPFASWLPVLVPLFHNVQVQLIPGTHALTMYHTPTEFCRYVTAFLKP